MNSRLTSALAASGASAFLVTNPVNIAYLCGFSGSAGALLVLGSRAVLATDSRYAEVASQLDVEGLITREYTRSLLDLAQSQGISQVAFESEHLTWRQHDDLSGHGLDLLATDHLVRTQRMIKDEREIVAIRRACEITSAALLNTIDAVRAGISERELARIFLNSISDRGADGSSFDPIVAIGANAARPHHQPTDATARPGDVVLFDVGARVEGYCADLSRTVVLGQPSERIQVMHEVVLSAQKLAREAIAPGVSAGHIDQIARSHIASAGFGDDFLHGTGHGIGLEIHEPPLLGSASEGMLEKNFVVTVEPGIYISGLGGVRIEDTVLVTANGHESLTNVSRELTQC